MALEVSAWLMDVDATDALCADDGIEPANLALPDVDTVPLVAFTSMVGFATAFVVGVVKSDAWLLTVVVVVVVVMGAAAVDVVCAF